MGTPSCVDPVPGRAPLRLAAAQPDLLTCANTHTEPRSSSYSKHSAALATLPLRRRSSFLTTRFRRVLGPALNAPPSSLLLQALSVAGLGAGLTEAVVVNPFEVVKVSLQANRDAFKQVPGPPSLVGCSCAALLNVHALLPATLLVRSSQTHHKDGRVRAERSE